MSNAVDTFRHKIEQAGLTPPTSILADGQLHRFASNGDPTDDAGWYIYFPGKPPAGMFGCWRTNVKQTWSGKADATLTKVDRMRQQAQFKEAQRQRDQEGQHRQATAAQRAHALWAGATPAPEDHPYLTRKLVHPHGVRLDAEGRLLVPVMIDGALSSLQFISEDGRKRFLPGGAVAGGAYPIGELTAAETALLCEGFATGASLHEATGFAVVVAFSASNLTPVAAHLRQHYPTVKILVCGDHDLRDDGAPNTGLDAATAAAHEVGGILVMPELDGLKCDWNDVHAQRGLDAIKAAITAALQHEDTATSERGSILDDVYVYLGKFVAYPSEAAQVAHCLWVAHTHLMEHWESTPRLALLSPEPGSGKTRAMELTETLVPRPVEAINVTSAYFFRKISDPQGLPTILHDEIDTIFGPKAKEHEEVRGVINAGHRRGASSGRCVMKGRTIETEEFPAFCAVAVAGLGNLPQTILSRSVIIPMRRRAPGEVVQPYRRRIHAPEGHCLRDRLAAWAQHIGHTLKTNPVMPDGLEDRNADVWEALLAVADAAGGDWPARARVAAVALVAANQGNQPSLGIRLLTDLRDFFETQQVDAAWTEEILMALHNLQEAPWGDLKGKPLDSRKLSNFLRPYGIKSKQVKINLVNQRGYDRADLQDAWTRYLPLREEKEACVEPALAPQIAATSATSATDSPSSVGPMSKTVTPDLYAHGPEEVLDLDT